MLNGENLSLNRVSEVRDVTANSTQLLLHIVSTTTSDDGAPVTKRPRMQKTVVPINGILADVTECRVHIV